MKILQFGRSMIEMLGVLAIIGVLSIGGIAGYRIAMNKYQANVILEDVNRFAFTIIERSPLPDGEISPADFVKTTPYTITAENDVEENYFYIDVHDVPKGVCHELVNKKSNDFEIYAGEQGMDLYQGDEDICAGINLMAFLFDTGEDFCQKDSDCGHCSECVNNRCQYGFKNKDEDCKSCGGDSTVYAEAVILNVREEECRRCKNRVWSVWGGDGACFVPLNRNINYWPGIAEAECKRFPNQHYDKSNGTCFYCDGAFDWTTGLCSTADQYKNPWGTSMYGINEETCVQQWNGSYWEKSTTYGKISGCYKKTGFGS